MPRRIVLLLSFLLVAALWPLHAAETVSFRLKDINGSSVDLADLRAKGPVLLSFWATYCEPCKKEIPHLIDLVKGFQSQNLQLALVAVDSPRSQKQIKPYVNSKGWGMPVLLDANGQTMKKFKGSNPPYTVLVSATGEVLYAHGGYKPGDEKALEEELRHILAPAGGKEQ